MKIEKTEFGLAKLGSYGYSSQGTRGGYEVQSNFRIDFDDHGYTLIPYYNNPSMAIPYRYGWYLHDELPAYMIKWDGNWLVGTYKQIEGLVKHNRDRFS